MYHRAGLAQDVAHRLAVPVRVDPEGAGKPRASEALARPENGSDRFPVVQRASITETHARVMLVAAMNPCLCGYFGDRNHPCRCTPQQIRQYQGRISGPLLDRIDLHVEVPSLSFQILTSDQPEESSEAIRSRVIQCRQVQSERYKERSIKVNALMRARDIREFAAADLDGRKLIEMAMKELRLSARAYYKILKIARTIADLAGCKHLQSEHIAEAIQYRSLDRQWWR